MGFIVEFNSFRRKKVKVKMFDITKEKKIEIEKKVNNIISNFDFSNSPTIDIVSLVKNDGFAVQSSEMDMETTGCLIVNDLETVMDTKKNRVIVVNKFFNNNNNDENFILKKSRFITAHEYGHFILHKEPGHPIYAHRDTYHRTEPEELEADYFARSILMPYKIFSKYVKTIHDLNIVNTKKELIDILSTIFKATKDKVTKRLKDLDELKECM